MTPLALVNLVARALGRPGSAAELEDWERVLERIPDDVADQALLDHRATSTYPPTVADVRRISTGILNDRAMRAEATLRRLERDTGRTADGQPLVPMPAEVRVAAAHLAARQRARDTALSDGPETSGPTDTPGVSHPTWPCCAHCTGTDDPIGHPPHRTPCGLCPTHADAGATA